MSMTSLPPEPTECSQLGLSHHISSAVVYKEWSSTLMMLESWELPGTLGGSQPCRLVPQG